jgi:hypothetical protein
MKSETHILKLDQNDEDAEIEFELDWLMSLSTVERFDLMFAKSAEMIRMLEQHGHREPDSVVKRPRG